MQIMGGIGYTDIYPIERALRAIRLGMIWPGTSEIMNLMIQHEHSSMCLPHLTDFHQHFIDSIMG
jgi:alkylation response protein AidB-like acyl-CoA dehydrogenase